MITETVVLYSSGGMSILDLVDRSDKKLTEHLLENGLRFHTSVSAARFSSVTLRQCSR